MTTTNSSSFLDIIDGSAGAAQSQSGIALKAFVLNLAVGVGLFVFELSGFFMLRSSAIGRRIYQPKTYLVQDRLRVEPIPANPIKWIQRIFSIKDEELKAKCGLDGYFFIRLLRAMIIIFVPMMVIIVTVLLPVNYHEGKHNHTFIVGGKPEAFNVTGLDTLSWQNVPPNKTDRYWAHLICALLVISWTLYRMYREKLNFIDVRQRFLTSPEHRLKASARTVLVTNIPEEYRSKEALEALYDVFVDNDDRTRLTVWVNRDYGSLRSLVARRRKLRHALEKEELRVLRMVNKKYRKSGMSAPTKHVNEQTTEQPPASEVDEGDVRIDPSQSQQAILKAHDTDCSDHSQLWRDYLPESTQSQISIVQNKDGTWKEASFLNLRSSDTKKVSKIAWLRAEVGRLSVQIADLLPKLDDEEHFKKQNSAFIQFDRQMAAHMACSLASHTLPGRMEPRFLEVAPHEIVWPNMGLTSLGRLIRTCIALVLFVAMLFLWVGSPTRGKREVVTQNFYFTFLFVELVLVTSISSGIIAVLPEIISNPVNIPTILANNLPKASNYFFNYLIIQGLGFSGSVLFQYLRLLYVNTIWPFFTQTPRQEAWLQTTIPHQMWANVYSLMVNFAVIGLIYSIISPLMLIFVSCMFGLFWVAYRHNYYYVQRVKVDTHGLLFNNAISQLFAGVYVLEMALIGLFFLVRDTQDNVACKSQAIIMIVVLILTAGFHFIMEQRLAPLYEFLPIALEDAAVDAEKLRFLGSNDNEGDVTAGDAAARESGSGEGDPILPMDVNTAIAVHVHPESALGRSTEKQMASRFQMRTIAGTAARARELMARLRKETRAKVTELQSRLPEPIDKSHRRNIADQLAAAIASYPDELTDLSLEERQAELRAAFQDPVTREPPAIIWIPQDPAGVSDDAMRQASKYGRYLQYSNTGAYLTAKNKCEVTQPSPDVRPDWLLEWVL
ncbi:hypothetical protein MBLNU459_g0132t2 [Dothideomycetes sp. NU459]